MANGQESVRSNGRIPKYLILGLLSICAALFVNTLVSYRGVTSLVRAERWVEHTMQVRETVETLLTTVTEAEAAERGYVITGNATFQQEFDNASTHASVLGTALTDLTSDNADLHARMATMDARVREKFAWMQSVIEARRTEGEARAMALLNTGTGMRLMEKVRIAHAAIQTEENRLFAVRSRAAEDTLRTTMGNIGAFTIGGLFLIWLVFYFVQRFTRDQRKAEKALHDSNQMLQLVLDHIPQRIFWKDRESRFLGCNSPLARDANLSSPAELVGKTDNDMPWRDHADHYQADDRAVLESNAPKLNYEERVRREDGTDLWVRTSKVPFHDVDGRPIGVLGTFEDITESKLAESKLRLQASALESSANGIFIVNASSEDYQIEYVNPAFETITGYKADEAIGQSISALRKAHEQQDGFDTVRSMLSQSRPYRAVVQDYRKDGTPFSNELSLTPVHDGGEKITHYVVIMTDVTHRILYQRQIEHQANFDPLTGLPNRNLLQDRVAQAIVRAERYRYAMGIVLIDLDHFKYLNDSFGYQFGDALLKAVAGRLTEVVRHEDTVARLGEDAFVLVLCGYDDDHAISSVVRRVLAHVAEPIVFDGHETRITCSIGISLYEEDGIDGETLLRNADIAMYRAKEAGRNTFEVFHPDMTRRIQERLVLEQSMRKGLEREEFMLQYQPQVDLRSGLIRGAEALLRWRHPEKGMISPATFIPVAEESDMILLLGDWVLRAACRQAKAWRDAGLEDVTVSVNVSVRQFRQVDFPDRVMAALNESGLDPNYLELELTESVLMTHIGELLQVLDRLKRIGVGFAIDDFGTGYSSLSYLKRLPVDKLKIDQSFVRDIPQDRNDMAIAKAIVALARSMDLTVIAEGVETQAQLDFLREHGCDEIQGFYFSKPVDPDVFAQMLSEGRSL